MSTYTDIVAANTPKGCDLSTGWPDSERDNRVTVTFRCPSCGETETEVTTGKGFMTEDDFLGMDCECGVIMECVGIENAFDDNDGELGFSWDTCDLCNDLPGNRHMAQAVNIDTGEAYALSVCCDCVQYIANGEEP